MNALYIALGIAALLVIVAMRTLFSLWLQSCVVHNDEDHAESERRVREIVSSTAPAPLESKRPHIRAGGGKI